MNTVLVVDDDKEIVDAIEIYLKNEGIGVIKAYDGIQAIQALMEKEILLILMDIMMPMMDGLRTTMKIREEKNIPIILISAKSEDTDKVLGLNMGADDYITKPYSPKELVLRVNNIIRRVYTKERQKITYKDYIIDLDKRMAFQGDEDLNLTTLEFDLLYMFVTNKEKSFSRDDILNNIWGENYFGTDRVVDDLIRRLRKKMPLLDINTIYGYGYRLL